MVVYTKQDPQASVKASGSGDPLKPYISVERSQITKDN
jgi:hypothetical protein